MFREKYAFIFKKQTILVIVFILVLLFYSIITTLLLLNRKSDRQLTQVNTETNKKENKILPAPPILTISKLNPPTTGEIFYSEKHESNLLTNKKLNVATGYEEGIGVSTASESEHHLISNDGKKLAYYDSNFGLAIRDLKSNTTTLLLENKKVFDKPTETQSFSPFQWSPDNKKLLVNVGYFEAGTLGVLDVEAKIFKYITNVDGTGAGCVNGKWMKDSQRIILYGYNYGHPCNAMPGLYVVNIANMQTQPLFGTYKNDFTFSVDQPFERNDNKLIFKATKDFTKKSTEDGIYEIDLNTKEVTKINVEQSGDVRLDNDSYFYSTGDKIMLYNLKTKESRLIVENQDKTLTLIPVTLSPDNKYLAYVLRVVKYNKFGNSIYSNTTEDNILKVVDLETLKTYDLIKNVDIYSPIIWFDN